MLLQAAVFGAGAEAGEEIPGAPVDGCCRAALQPGSSWPLKCGAGWSLCSMVLVAGCWAVGDSPVSGVVCIPCPWQAAGGIPCYQAGIPGPGLSEAWGQESWGQVCALPVLGAGPWPFSFRP